MVSNSFAIDSNFCGANVSSLEFELKFEFFVEFGVEFDSNIKGDRIESFLNKSIEEIFNVCNGVEFQI